MVILIRCGSKNRCVNLGNLLFGLLQRSLSCSRLNQRPHSNLATLPQPLRPRLRLRMKARLTAFFSSRIRLTSKGATSFHGSEPVAGHRSFEALQNWASSKCTHRLWRPAVIAPHIALQIYLCHKRSQFFRLEQ